MDVYIDSLIYEVTRDCNMSCKHCLRGPRQKKYMDISKIHSFLSWQSKMGIYAGSLTITGGEPLLYYPFLNKLSEAYKRFPKSRPEYLYMKTNGKAEKVAVTSVISAYLNIPTNLDGDGLTQLVKSVDVFHSSTANKDRTPLSLLSFYSKEEWKESNRTVSVIVMGKAVRLFNGGWSSFEGVYIQYRRLHIEELDTTDEQDGVSLMIPQVYITVSGNILPCCDLSYEFGDKRVFIVCNVNDLHKMSVKDFVKRYKEAVDSGNYYLERWYDRLGVEK